MNVPTRRLSASRALVWEIIFAHRYGFAAVLLVFATAIATARFRANVPGNHSVLADIFCFVLVLVITFTFGFFNHTQLHPRT